MQTALAPQTMRLILWFTLFGMQALAGFYLCRRRLPFLAYLGWGLVTVFIPALGPFLVILWHPGEPLRPAWGGRNGRLI